MTGSTRQGFTWAQSRSGRFRRGGRAVADRVRRRALRRRWVRYSSSWPSSCWTTYPTGCMALISLGLSCDTSEDVIPVSARMQPVKPVILVSFRPSRGEPMATVDLPRPDVPRPIAVVRDFVNTTDHETGIDELTTPAELSALPRAPRACWRGPRGPRADDLELARRLRAGLRRALELNHDGSDDPLPALTDALTRAPGRSRLDGRRRRAAARAPGVRGALAEDRPRCPRGHGRGHLVAAEDLRVRRVRVGLLRPLEEPVAELVRVRLRQQDQDPRLPCAPGWQARPSRPAARPSSAARRSPTGRR